MSFQILTPKHIIELVLIKRKVPGCRLYFYYFSSRELATVSGNKTPRAVVSDSFTGCWPQFALVLSPWCSMKMAVKTSVFTDSYTPDCCGFSCLAFVIFIYNCERRELPSQYGRPKKRHKIFNIGRRTILYKTFSYSFSILN